MICGFWVGRGGGDSMGLKDLVGKSEEEEWWQVVVRGREAEG